MTRVEGGGLLRGGGQPQPPHHGGAGAFVRAPCPRFFGQPSGWVQRGTKENETRKHGGEKGVGGWVFFVL